MSLLQRTAPPERAGEAMGARAALASGSQTFLPIAFGGLGASLGIAAIFWSTAALLAGGAAFVHRRAASARP